MWFWWFILICDCIIPAIMIIAGRMMWKHCPKKINGVVGYRTKMSMINMDTWRFAHDHAGKLWWKVGIGLLGPTMLIHIPFYGASDDTMGILSIIIIVIQLVFLIGSIFPTEKALKNNFNEDGTKRQIPIGLNLVTEENEGYIQCEKLALLNLSIRGYKKVDRLPVSEMMNVSDAIQGIFGQYSSKFFNRIFYMKLFIIVRCVTIKLAVTNQIMER